MTTNTLFKEGDKVRTRRGDTYVVAHISADPSERFPVAMCNGEGWLYLYSSAGVYNANFTPSSRDVVCIIRTGHTTPITESYYWEIMKARKDKLTYKALAELEMETRCSISKE